MFIKNGKMVGTKEHFNDQEKLDYFLEVLSSVIIHEDTSTIRDKLDFFLDFVECENSCGHFNEWEKLDYFLEVLSSVKIE